MVKSPLLRFLVLVSLTASCMGGVNDLKLWYDEPAGEWVDSLPIGNGRLLATNQGGVHREVIQLNEDTIWSGQPRDTDNPEGARYLSEVRRLVFDGKYAEAQKLAHTLADRISWDGMFRRNDIGYRAIAREQGD